MLRNTLLILLLFTSVISVKAATEIFGNAKEYAGSELVFYKYSDRITFIKEQLFVLKIDENGDFKTSFENNDVTYVFGEFGIYHAYFYAEPNASYELMLPPYLGKEDKDNFNPFFSVEKIQIGIKNLKNTDLNYLILDFDYYYDRYVDLNYLDIYAGGLSSDVDTFINSINDHYKYATNSYFQTYKKYRVAALKNIATQKKYESAIVFAYFTNDTVRYDNPAYMDLFNNIYKDYFDKYLASPDGALLYAVINYGHSVSRLKKLMSKNIELKTPQFRELVILKGINDSFSNNNLSWLPVLLTLDSVHLSTIYPMHKTIAQNIADNSLSMAKGTIAPPFELPDTSGVLKKLGVNRGKYVYLQFANTETYSCQIEFDLLKKLYDRYKGVCIFITILTDNDTAKAKEFIRSNKYEWQFLFAEMNSPVISTYNIVSYPTYFLIDPYGTLMFSPAPSPSENFEKMFFEIIERPDKNHQKPDELKDNSQPEHQTNPLFQPK